MIELNLLPDVKQQYIKAEKSRRLVISISVILIAGSIALLVLLLFAGALQRKHISDLNNDIKKYSDELKSKPQISRILTVQNQLQSLTALHDDKPAVGKLFDYLNQVTPTQVDISSFKVDFTANTITITGNADALNAVNKYIDTLKYTSFTKSGSNTSQKAFSNVVMTSFGISGGTASGGTSTTRPATYTITLSYDPSLFDITSNVKLSVPSTSTSSRSTDLFKEAPKTVNQGAGR